MVNEEGKIHCALVIGKSHITPLKFISIPRLKLTTTVLSVKISKQLKQKLKIECFDGKIEAVLWTDSQVVLHYINNESVWFKVFATNCIQMLIDNTSEAQWHYVISNDNLGDRASRGLNPHKKEQVEVWSEGPDFLYQPVET